MKEILSGVSADGAGDKENRTGNLVVSAIAKYHKTGAGTCTLTFKDGRTDATLHEFTVSSTDPEGDNAEIALPASYYAEVSSASGTFSLSAWVDGDA